MTTNKILDNGFRKSIAKGIQIFFFLLGSTHGAAWSGATSISRSSNRFNLGSPQLVPPSYISLLKVDTGLLRDRLNVLWSFADMIGKHWKLMGLNSLVSKVQSRTPVI